MAYLKPAAFTAKVFNKVAMRTGLAGSTTLAIAGRTSGEIQTIPVILVEHEGARYLVSTRGESEWVRNLRAAGGRVEVRGRGGPQALTAREVPVGQRAPIIAAYRRKAGKTVEGYWKKLPDDADHPTFVLS